MGQPVIRTPVRICPFCPTEIFRKTPNEIMRHLCTCQGDNSSKRGCVFCPESHSTVLFTKMELLGHIEARHLQARSQRVLTPQRTLAPRTIRPISLSTLQNTEAVPPITPTAIRATTEIAPSNPNPSSQLLFPHPQAPQPATVDIEGSMGAPSPVPGSNSIEGNYESGEPDASSDSEEDQDREEFHQLRDIQSLRDSIISQTTAFRLRFLRFLLLNRVTEREFAGLKTISKDLFDLVVPDSTNVLPLMDDIMMGNVRSLRRHVRSLMGDSLPALKIPVPRGSFLEGAYVPPEAIVSYWLSNTKIQSTLDTVYRKFIVPWIRSGETQMPLNGGSNCWNSLAFWQSLGRARSFWEPRYLEAISNGVHPIFIELGLFFDWFGFLGSARPKNALLMLELLNVEQSRVERLPTLMPLALFFRRNDANPEVDENLVEYVLAYLQPTFIRLARGLDLNSSGNCFRVFCFTGELKADIPAMQEILGLKQSSRSYHPCPSCKVRHTVQSQPAEEVRCVFDHSAAIEPKTPAEYSIAYSGEPRELSSVIYSVKRQTSLMNFPGFSIPSSVAMDLMHVMFLGEAKKLVQEILDSFMMPIDPAGCKEVWGEISSTFERLLKLNGVCGWSKLTCLNDLKKLKAHDTYKFLVWSKEIFACSGVLLDFLPQHTKDFWSEFLRLNGLLCQYSLSEEDLLEIARLSESYSATLCSHFPGLCSLKSHMMLHFREQPRLFGPPRRVWNFRCEGSIGTIKKFFENVNNTSVPTSILGRVVELAFLETVLEEGDLPIERGTSRSIPGKFGSIKVGCYYKSVTECLVWIVGISDDIGRVKGRSAQLQARGTDTIADMASAVELDYSSSDLSPVDVAPTVPEDGLNQVNAAPVVQENARSPVLFKIIYDPNPFFNSGGQPPTQATVNSGRIESGAHPN